MQSILIIDDSDEYREIAREVLSIAGFSVFDAPSPKDAFELLMGTPVDLILCDLHMPFSADQDAKNFVQGSEMGFRTVKELAWALPSTPIVVLSASSPADLTRLGKFLSPIPAFSKPLRHQDLVTLVQRVLGAESREVHLH